METAMTEMNRKQLNELDTWMRQFAYDYAAALEPSKFIQNPIHKVGQVFEQKEVLCKISEIEDKVLAEAARILGVAAVERSSYSYLNEDIEMIVEVANDDIDSPWALVASDEHLNLVRTFNSFREIWDAKLDHLVPESERPTERRTVVVELDLETLNSQNLRQSSLQDALKNVIGSIGRVHTIHSLDDYHGSIYGAERNK
jgi:hypothetical protein